MGAFVVILLLALIAGELLLRLIAPGLLARLAYIPFKPARVVPLSRAATERLTQSGPVESDYRTAPERRIALTQLLGPNVLDTNGIRLIFGRGGGNVVAFRRLDAQKKVRPLVFVRLRAEGDRIVLSSRFVPSNILLLAAFLALFSWNMVMTQGLVGLLVVGFFLGALARGRLRGDRKIVRSRDGERVLLVAVHLGAKVLSSRTITVERRDMRSRSHRSRRSRRRGPRSHGPRHLGSHRIRAGLPARRCQLFPYRRHRTWRD